MKILEVELNDEVEAYLREVVSDVRADPRSKGLVAVLLKYPNSIPEVNYVGDDLVHMGLYPEKQRKWDYAVRLKNDSILVNQLLADELTGGNKLSIRKVVGVDGQQKSQIFLKNIAATDGVPNTDT